MEKFKEIQMINTSQIVNNKDLNNRVCGNFIRGVPRK